MAVGLPHLVSIMAQIGNLDTHGAARSMSELEAVELLQSSILEDISIIRGLGELFAI